MRQWTVIYVSVWYFTGFIHNSLDSVNIVECQFHMGHNDVRRMEQRNGQQAQYTKPENPESDKQEKIGRMKDFAVTQNIHKV